MKHIIYPIKALTDNYVWAVFSKESNSCLIVDPGESDPVKNFLHSKQLEICGILVTHHHYDHTDGIRDLVKNKSIPVWGPDSGKIAHVNRYVSENEIIHINELELSLKAMLTPGHTLDHISFFNDEILFCGDTLFAGGIGRIFEGTAKQMFESIVKIKKLNENTKVYCGHEYTLSNLEFASQVEPNNKKIANRLEHVRKLRSCNKETLPSLLEEEFATNPFLRTAEKDVITAINLYYGSEIESELEVFSKLRAWKDTA